jgi:hypothetical protein
MKLSLCCFFEPPITFSLTGSNIFLSILYSNERSICKSQVKCA